LLGKTRADAGFLVRGGIVEAPKAQRVVGPRWWGMGRGIRRPVVVGSAGEGAVPPFQKKKINKKTK